MTLKAPAVAQKVYMVRGDHRIATVAGSSCYHVQKFDGKGCGAPVIGGGPWDYYANAKNHLMLCVGPAVYHAK